MTAPADPFAEHREATIAELMLDLVSHPAQIVTALRRAYDAGTMAGVDASLAILRGASQAMDEAAGRKPEVKP